MTIASLSRHYTATEEDGDPEIAAEGIWRKKLWTGGYKYGWGRWWQQKTALDGDKWHVEYAPLEVTRHKSTQVTTDMVANREFIPFWKEN